MYWQQQQQQQSAVTGLEVAGARCCLAMPCGHELHGALITTT